MQKEKRIFTNHDLMILEQHLAPCAGQGNVPTMLATGHNLKRVHNALKSVRQDMTADDEMKYFVESQALQLKVASFDPERYARGMEVDEEDTSEEAVALRRYAAEWTPSIEAVESFDELKFMRGKKKVVEVGEQPNDDFEPYYYNMEKLSDDLGDQRMNSAITMALIMFGQVEGHMEQ